MESKRTTASHFKLSFPKGFTLLEVLIAMTIMATSALLLSTAWRGNHVRLQKIQINKKAAFLLEETLTELTFKYQNRLSQLPEQENGQFASNPLFTWSMKSQKFTMPDLNSLLVAQDQGDGALLMMMDQFKKYLNQSVKEVQVTVTYTKGKRKIDYSATTLLVDYDQPLPFGL